ncbi:branched-chain amino acid ABC transporter permease [Modestobacter lapidis]|nr:branched-chain amino acid ABC transporter permease [Modestobacter lapidis]
MSPNIDNPAFLLQLLVGGLTNGALYALVALAVVLVYKTTSHINLAQGEMATLGAFVVFALTQQGVQVWIAIAIALVVSFVFGAGVERGLIRPLEKRGIFPVVLATLALFLIINAVIAIIWGTQPVPAPEPFPREIEDKIDVLVGPPPFFITYVALGILAVLVLLLVGLWLLLEKTKLGLGYRAVAANREAAEVMGIPVGRMFMFGWGIAGALGTLAAALVAETAGTLDFNSMASILIFGLAAATLGGFDSVPGAAVGGLALGLIMAFVPGLFTFIEGDLSLVIALIVVLVVLLVRPQGLFGTKTLERV